MFWSYIKCIYYIAQSFIQKCWKHNENIYKNCPLTLLSNVLSLTKLSSASLTRDKSFLAAVTIETITSWRMASSGSCDLTLKNSG